jgi:hypothetical protein
VVIDVVVCEEFCVYMESFECVVWTFSVELYYLHCALDGAERVVVI